MIASELRLGNYVIYNNNEIGTVSGIQSFLTTEDKVAINERIDIFYNTENINPILLTKEWLFKLGFENHFDRVEEINYYCIKDFVIEEDFFCFGYAEPIVYDLLRVNSKNPLKYVHQLQNLFFALNGEELVIC